MAKEKKPRPPLAKIFEAAAKHFNIGLESLTNKNASGVGDAKKAAVYLARDIGYTYESIAEYMGFSPTTVLGQYKNATEKQQRNKKYQSQIGSIRQALKDQGFDMSKHRNGAPFFDAPPAPQN